MTRTQLEAMTAVKAPPPTPIATGKGARTSAVNDGELGKYLESSLKIPELALPTPFPCSLNLLHRKIPSGIDLQALRRGDENAVSLLLAAASSTGAFRIDGHGLALEDVRLVVELAAARGGGCGVVGMEDEVVSLVRKMGGGVMQELCWSGPAVQEAAAGKAPVTDTYRVLREKLEELSTKLEEIAETVAQVISARVKSPSPTKTVKKGVEGYLLLLKKHDLHRRRRSGDEDCDDPSHSLSLHLSLDCREFRLRSDQGSTSYGVPAVASLIVTIGRQLQEWSKGELKAVMGEPVFVDRCYDRKPCFSLEFMWSPLPRRRNVAPPAKHHISVMDQVLMVVALVFLLSFWALDPSKPRKS